MTKNITFSLPAEAVEGATEAILLGDFNNWNPEKAPRLEKQADGSFNAVARLEEGKTYHYRFLLNDGRWVNDYNAQSYVSVDGFSIDNCVITVQESLTEEHITGKPVKIKAGNKKASKDESAHTHAKEDIKPVTAKATKKTTAKAKGAKSTKAKSAEGKAQNAEKPAKAVKKELPSDNK